MPERINDFRGYRISKSPVERTMWTPRSQSHHRRDAARVRLQARRLHYNSEFRRLSSEPTWERRFDQRPGRMIFGFPPAEPDGGPEPGVQRLERVPPESGVQISAAAAAAGCPSAVEIRGPYRDI